jgi:outer membrane protein
MKKTLMALFALLNITIMSAQADTLGLYAGVGTWGHEASGDFSSTQAGSTVIDVEDTLNFDSENEGYVWVAIEHFVPLVPNVRFEQNSLSHQGNVSTSVNFQGSSVTGEADIVLDHTDIILYYSPLDNWVNLDIGLDLRMFDGEATVGTETSDVSETIPMLFVAAQFDLPLTGLSVGADYRFISYDGNSMSDMKVRGVYEIGIVGFEAGYLTKTIELEDISDLDANIDFDGLFFGAFLHF